MPGRVEPHKTGGRERYILEDFTAGLHSEESFSKVAILDTECTCAENIVFWPVGTISKRPGRTYKNETTQLSGSVIGLYQWWSNAGANYLLAFTAASAAGSTAISGAISYILSSGGTQSTCVFGNIISGGVLQWNPPTTAIIVTETFGGSAFFANGVDPLLVWNGTDSCCAVTTAPTGATCIRSYKNYLFAANAESNGVRYYSRLWWSNPGDGHTWPATNWMDLDGDDGDYISAMEILGNELIVFKERKIIAVTYVGGQYEFYAEGRQSGVGCAAGGSVVPIFNELLFYGIENFYSFNGRDVESLGDKIKDLITSTILPTNRAGIKGMMYEEKDQILWAVPAAESSYEGNTHLFVLDYTRDSWTIHTGEVASFSWYSQTSDLTLSDLLDAYSSYGYSWGTRLFLSNAALTLVGTYDGYIIDNGTAGVLADLGEDYVGFWRSRWIDFGMPDTNKRIIRMTIYIDKEVEEAADDYDLYLHIYTDWNKATIAKTEAISVYGQFPVLERRVDLSLTCRAFQMEIGTTLKNQPFTVHRIVIEYLPKGRTLVV